MEIGLSNAAMATLLAVFAAGLCRLYRRPALAHGLWLVVLLKLVTPPLVEVPLPWFDSREPARPTEESTGPVFVVMPEFLADAGGVAAGPQPEHGAIEALVPVEKARDRAPGDSHLAFWCWLVLVIWVGGSGCTLVRIVWSVVLFRRVLRFAHKAEASVQALARGMANKLGLARHPDVWLVPANISPMLWALGVRPRLLFPAALLERLDREQLRSIFLHELAHWRRRDHWVRLLEMVVVILYWWHPVVWWARAELREAEEQCCDAWVVGALNGAGRAYALALLETVAFLSRTRLPLPASASGIGQVFHLRRRVTMILGGPQRKSMSVAGCATVAGFAVLVLPLIPVVAEEPPKKTTQGIVVNFEDIGVVVSDDNASDREAVELLKRALKLLAEKKQADAKSAAKTADPEMIKKARIQVEALAREVAQRQNELRAAEAKLHHAKVDLATLEGQTGGMLPRFEYRLVPGTGEVGTPEGNVIFRLAPQPMVEQKPVLRIKEGNVIWSLEPGAPVKKATPEELKARVDRLLKEVEEIRREIERGHGPSTPAGK
jgi:beta-lactamase regulating signal transducer with metallopeptidase domain